MEIKEIGRTLFLIPSMVLPPTERLLLSGAIELICFAALVVLRIRWQHGLQWSTKKLESRVPVKCLVACRVLV